MRFNILTYNNGVGIVTDAILLKNLIENYICESVQIMFLDNINSDLNADVGIWIQNYDINLLHHYKKNIFFINEEWVGTWELESLHLFDQVICKSQYAKNLLKSYNNITYIPFISKDVYNHNVKRSNNFLHFMGRSIQKNTELVLKQSVPITLIDPYNRYKPPSNFTHINSYQTNESISSLLNSHNIHICCSLYESWGHYLFEGLSTGNEIICSDIPAFKENLDPDLVHFIPCVEATNSEYLFNTDNINNTFILRHSYYVNPLIFEHTLIDFKPKGRSEERRLLYQHIINNSKNKLINFFKNI